MSPLPEIAAGASCVVLRLDGTTGSNPSGAVLDELRSPSRISIAAIDGVIGADDTSAVLSCDLVLMSAACTWQISDPASLDPPATGASEALVGRVGPGRALLLVSRSRPIDAAKAYELGLVDEVVAVHAMQERLDELLADLSLRPPGWVAETKALFASAAGPQHEAQGRARQRRRELDAAARLARQADDLQD